MKQSSSTPERPWPSLVEAHSMFTFDELWQLATDKLSARSESAPIPLPHNFDPKKDVALRRGEYALLMQNARRYEWLKHNMRVLRADKTGARHFIDVPPALSFDEAVDKAKESANG